MKRLILLISVLLLLAGSLSSAIYEYFVFSTGTGTYAPITGTPVTSILSDDALSEEIPIGFTFVYGLEIYTSVKISSNGWVGLGGSAPHSNLSNELSATTTYSTLAPLWDDTSLWEGNCQYLMSGTAPNRIFTIQYENLHWYYGSNNQHNIQVLLYETGKVEFRYGPSTGTPENASASIGINMIPGGINNFYSVTPGTPASASYVAENSTINMYPGNGMIYSFETLAPVPNDLAAFSLTGNQTPTQGAAAQYSVTVRNMGTAPQTNYSVKLMSGTTELASVNGPAIAPGMMETVNISWTPQTTGAMTIFGKAVLTGDAYPQNDNTNSLNLFIQPAGTFAVTVGTGNETDFIPVDMYYKNSLFETIYQAGEITASGMITGISFYNTFSTNLLQKPTKIWLGFTQLTNLTAGWVPSTQLVQVFDGPVDYPSGTNLITIPLTVPFAYGGGNLIMLVNRPMDIEFYNFEDKFFCQTVGEDRSRFAYSDTDNYDPANPDNMTGSVSGQFPKTTFYFTPSGPNPTFGVAPAGKDFGTVLLNSTQNQTFSLFNSGGGTLTVSSIAISGSPYFTLQNLPTLPAALTSGQITSFGVVYHPTAAGNHTATITITDDLARATHTVQVSGVCLDPTIYTSPYVQNFDAVTVPRLPLDWNKLVAPVGNGESLGSSTQMSSSSPNSILMNNGWGDNMTMLLIAPPLAPSLNINIMRVKFKAYSDSPASISVGVMADITDALTFTQLGSVTATGNWAEFVVSLSSYTGTGRYIAFKHNNDQMFQNIYIDDVTIEVTPNNDLAALSVSGNTTPSVGVAYNYTVNVYNWGINTQSNYQVKLFREGDIEVASVAGPAITGDSQATVSLSWTPATAGATYLYAKTILTGDQNALNDQSPIFNVLVQAEGTTAITIGEGNQMLNIPVNMYWRNSLYEVIYHAEDIPAGGFLTGISFYNNFVTNLLQKPTRIWIGTTTQDDLTTGWIPSTGLSQVFDGLVDYPSGANTITIPFTTPFPYAGTNLVMMVQRPMDTTFYNWNDRFYCQVSDLNVSLEAHADDETFDPANPPAGGELTAYFPKTTMFFVPAGTTPMFGVVPLAKNFGTVLMNNTAAQTFTVFNSGGAALTVNSVSLTGSTMYNLQNVPVLPLTLNPGVNFTFTARYQPTAPGSHTATINIADNLARSRTLHAVPLSGVCVDPTIYTSPYAQNFDTATLPALPVEWQKINQTLNPTGTILTVNNTSHSAPNCAYINNSDNESGDMLIIAPPLANTLTLPAMRVKFWARTGWDAILQVGIISDATNAATFQSLASQTLSSEWQEYVVSLNTYTGTGRNIAFRHGMSSMYQEIYIDDVTIETTPQNDLAALAVTGNTTPSVGMVTNYTVTLFNWGLNPQTTYLVKLYNSSNTEVASVAGPTIASGASAAAVLPWAPTTQGPDYIYAKVVLTGDQNSLNDQSPNLNVAVQPAGVMVVTVGDGTESGRIPVDMYYQNSLFETVYQSSELNFIGMITGIAFYNNFETNLPAMPTNIWMGTTTQTDLSNDWIPSTTLTQVFSGNVDYPSGNNTITITLTQPFLYLSGNLVMMVERPMDTTYYSWSDMFYCQTVGNTRSRIASSDGIDFDPAAPPSDNFTLSGQFPKTSLFVIPGGVGHLNGTVLGAGNLPLQDATVQIIGGASTTTNAQGQYTINNIIAGTYEVTASHYGYISQTVTVVIPEDATVTQNFTLQQMPTVHVTGTVTGSDNPTVGLIGASITLTGYENYEATTNAQGQFDVPGVYTNQTYEYIISALGFQIANGSINVGASNYSFGTVVLDEIAYTPRNVTAMVDGTNLNLTWMAPDPGAVDVDQSFESDTFPPTDWTRVVTNNGPANTNGVYPTWCRFGTVTSGTETIAPSDGAWQCGFWWDYNHQDEWLISPPFNCPQGAYLSFDTFAYYGSLNGDHYYVKISNNNGVSWNVLWDASAQTGGWNYYQTPVQIDLTAYTGQQVKLAWHADDPNASSDGMWYNWFIDNIEVGNAAFSMRIPTSSLKVRSAEDKTEAPQPVVSNLPFTKALDARSLDLTRHTDAHNTVQDGRIRSRSLIGYRVWRLMQGQEQNEQAWTSLTPSNITAQQYQDTGFAALPAGTYKWAVKAVYTNDVYSLAAFSNAISTGTPPGTLTGFVRNQQNQPVGLAVITAGFYTATTNASGTYTMQLPMGVYNVTCTATGYEPMTMNNIMVNTGQTTTCNFLNLITPVEDVIQITATALLGNYPNPFNPQTVIHYEVKDIQPVRIEIYNVKGQFIRTLVSETKATGHYTAVWDGSDNHGKAVTSGVYHYRMQAGSYQANRRMLLLK